jgi:Tfp pilus assembly PilM family ATPase
VLPPEACTWKVVQWPFDDWPESPEEALRQIDPGLALPYDLSQAYLSLMPLPAAGAGLEACSSLMVSVSRQCVLRWIEVFDIAGVALERLEAAQVCELRALAPRLEGADAGLLEVLVVPERRGARITLLRHGVPEYGRRVLGSSAELESELERCLTYWRSRDPGVTGVRLWLSGSSPDLPLLADTLRQSGHGPVEILDPVEQGWFTLAPTASEEDPPPPGWVLGRLFGLMQGEVAR